MIQQSGGFALAHVPNRQGFWFPRAAWESSRSALRIGGVARHNGIPTLPEGTRKMTE